MFLPRAGARNHLDFTDWISESAVAVYMVMIVNGYVALSQLNAGYTYIIAVDIWACVAWGFIDGFTYAVGNAIDRGSQSSFLKRLKAEKDPERAVDQVVEELEGTFMAGLSAGGKMAVAREVVKNSEGASSGDRRGFPSRSDAQGFLSVMSIYLSIGLEMTLPYVILPNKLTAWLISDAIALAWLFSYGFRVGGIIQGSRILTGLITAGLGVAFLFASYTVFVGLP
jgi:hypothetical protein